MTEQNVPDQTDLRSWLDTNGYVGRMPTLPFAFGGEFCGEKFGKHVGLSGSHNVFKFDSPVSKTRPVDYDVIVGAQQSKSNKYNVRWLVVGIDRKLSAVVPGNDDQTAEFVFPDGSEMKIAILGDTI